MISPRPDSSRTQRAIGFDVPRSSRWHSLELVKGGTKIFKVGLGDAQTSRAARPPNH
jgi:hypothetical protein